MRAPRTQRVQKRRIRVQGRNVCCFAGGASRLGELVYTSSTGYGNARRDNLRGVEKKLNAYNEAGNVQKIAHILRSEA